MIMFYHASQIKDIIELEPRVSNHGIPLIFFSRKRENVLVYLSNAVEKYCKETDFEYSGTWNKWGPYGFEKDGRQRLEEYYPDAYEAILEAEKKGLITILRYNEMSDRMREWNVRTIKEEYEAAKDHPEYRHFLKGNFQGIFQDGN